MFSMHIFYCVHVEALNLLLFIFIARHVGIMDSERADRLAWSYHFIRRQWIIVIVISYLQRFGPKCGLLPKLIDMDSQNSYAKIEDPSG